MAKSDWNKHAAKYVKPAMVKAMAAARKTWKGSKKLTAAQASKVKSLQAQRDKVNAQIKSIKKGC